MSDSEYHVASQDWPTGASEEDLNLDRIYSVLNKFDQYFNAAVDGLSRIGTPATSQERNEARQ